MASPPSRMAGAQRRPHDEQPRSGQSGCAKQRRNPPFLADRKIPGQISFDDVPLPQRSSDQSRWKHQRCGSVGSIERPQGDQPDPGQRRQRRRHRHQVIGMKKPACGTEYHPVAQNPACPQTERQVLAGQRLDWTDARPGSDPADQRQREEPAHLSGLVGCREAQRSGRGIVTAGRRSAAGRGCPIRNATRRGGGGGCVDGRGVWQTTGPANKALDAIVADDQLEHRVGASAVDKGTALRRRQLVDRRPGQRYRRQHDSGGGEMTDPTPRTNPLAREGAAVAVGRVSTG